MQRGIVALVFLSDVVGERSDPPNEVDDIQWLVPEQLSRMTDAYRVRLLDARHAGAPRIRAHDGLHLVTPQR